MVKIAVELEKEPKADAGSVHRRWGTPKLEEVGVEGRGTVATCRRETLQRRKKHLRSLKTDFETMGAGSLAYKGRPAATAPGRTL